MSAAHSAVQYAVRTGRLPAVRTCACQTCGAAASQYHHTHGYEQKHWLDVIPLCSTCHRHQHAHARRTTRPKYRSFTTHIFREQVEMIDRISSEQKMFKGQLFRELLDRGFQNWRRETEQIAAWRERDMQRRQEAIRAMRERQSR